MTRIDKDAHHRARWRQLLNWLVVVAALPICIIASVILWGDFDGEAGRHVGSPSELKSLQSVPSQGSVELNGTGSAQIPRRTPSTRRLTREEFNKLGPLERDAVLKQRYEERTRRLEELRKSDEETDRILEQLRKKNEQPKLKPPSTQPQSTTRDLGGNGK